MIKAIFQVLVYIIWMVPITLLIGFTIIMSWLLGQFFASLFSIPFVVSFIIAFILLGVSTIGIFTKPNPSGGYSPVTHFFLGWLIGRSH